MKKRISLIMALLLVLGSLWVLASCTPEGETEELTVKPGGKEELTVPGTPNNGNGEAQGSDWVIDKIWEASGFQDGVAFIRYTVRNEKTDEMKVTKYALDVNGNILFELPRGDDSIFPEVVKNGVMVIDYRYIYDTKGTQIASPDSHGYDMVVNRTETQFMVVKEEKSFEGNCTYYGILNSAGEWVYPLTAAIKPAYEWVLPLTDDPDYSRFDFVADNTFALYSDEGFIGEHHIDTGTLYSYKTGIYKIDPYSGQTAGIYKGDVNGTQTLILEGYSLVAQKGSVYVCVKEENYINHYVAIDENGQVLKDYGTQLNLSYLDYKNGYLLCSAENPSGDYYYALITPDGELAFDPLPQKDSHGEQVYAMALTEEGFLTHVETLESMWIHQYTLHDYEGNALILPNTLDGENYFNLGNFSCGLALAGSRYFINAKGELVIDLTKLVIPE